VWVAAEQIYVDGALAYNEGNPIPTSNVKLHGYDRTKQAVKREVPPSPKVP
jgi:hypothetical protein